MAGMSQAQVAYQTEHIDDDRRPDILGTAISMAILSTIAVARRFACRKKLKFALSYDDYSILVGLILNLGICFDLGYAVGEHNAQQYLKMGYVFQLLYAHAITIIKLSILLFYCRLFPRESTSKRWRYCVYAIAAVCIGFFISGTITTIFQSRPISFFWTRKGKGKCVDGLAPIYFSQSLQVLIDILILTLPIPVVWKLRLRRSKKIGVLGIFLLGSLQVAAFLTTEYTS
ncbi:MAG: hypothetical protein LQ339_002081 [Xanthoria mediterranea]|nr:MAG: hypothetical protein LQ339_002081 [Xanthoria mediterranea]